MTRHEQILSEVQKRFLNPTTHIASKINAFVDGAKWADETMIDKVCRIYREHLIKFNPTLKEFPTALDEAVNIFRKQIEE